MRAYILTIGLSWFLCAGLVTASAQALEPRDASRGDVSGCNQHPRLAEAQWTNAVLAVLNNQTDPAYLDILSAEGCLGRVSTELKRQGARILFVDRHVGYLCVAVPPQYLLDVFRLKGIAAAGIFRWEKPRVDIPTASDEQELRQPPSIHLPIPRVARELPPGGPYFPAAEGGLKELREEYPEADGRGTRIAIIDTGLDLFHPALRMIKSSDRRLLPKVADIERVSLPELDAAWVTFGEDILAHNRKLLYANRTWTVPEDRPYRIGIYSRKFTVGALGDPAAQKVAINVGVLWDPDKNVIWVDTNGDQDFTNDPLLKDYSEQQDIGWFGTATADEDNRIPFAVKIDRARRAVYLEINDGPHGTMVASTATANRLTGGLFDGAAPMALIFDIDPFEPSSPAPLLPFALASARRDVDVISRSGPYARPGVGYEEHQKPIVEGFIRRYDKVPVCMCAFPGTLNVADYQSGEMLRRNRQAPPPQVESVHGWVWFTSDGLVNTIVAPSTSLLADSRYNSRAYRDSDGRLHANEKLLEPPAPMGYGIGANPSPTISYVSGTIAAVLSLAKQRHVRYNGTRITNAVFTSARLVPGFPASVQGHGLIDAAGLWHQLQRMAKADDPANPKLTSFEVLRGSKRSQRSVYGYSEEFDEASKIKQKRGVWIIRRGGYAGLRHYALALRGNDGTFDLERTSVDMPRDNAVYVPFTIKPNPDLHVAFLQLIDATAGVALQEVPLEVRAPQRMETVESGVERYQSQIEPRRTQLRYFRINRKAQAAQISVSIPDDGIDIGRSPVGVSRSNIRNVQLAISERGAPIDPEHHVGSIRSFEGMLAEDLGGMWELFWGNRGLPEYETPYDRPAPDVPILGTLTVSNYSISLERADDGHITLRNQLARVKGRVEFLAGKSVTREFSAPGPHSVAQVPSQIEAGTSVWRFAVLAKNRRLSAHVFALDCTQGASCRVVKHVRLKDGKATVLIDDPHPGGWRVAVLPDSDVTEEIYELQQTALKPVGESSVFDEFPSGATVSVPLPDISKEKDSTDLSIYAGFRIAPLLDQQRGALIAVARMSSMLMPRTPR